MHAHYLQHVPFEGLGSIEPWLKAAGYEISVTRFFAPEQLPEIPDIDFLIVMGGPMSVNDEQELPWLVEEKRFVRRAIDAGKPVLGICLGAQIIAQSLGASVFPNAEKEIGWFPITGISSGAASIVRFPDSIDVFHWHGETFDLPVGATLLARSKGCAHQAFQFGDTVIGLQFHLETTPDLAQAIVDNCRSELVPSQFVQGETEILSASAGQYCAINRVMDDVLEGLTRT